MAQVVKTSFDTNTTEGKMRIFNAQNGASQSMKDLEDGHVMTVSDVLIYEDVIDSYGKEQSANITVLFNAEGIAYASVSETVASASDKLIDFLADSGLETVDVKLVKQLSRNNQEFLNLQMVM